MRAFFFFFGELAVVLGSFFFFLFDWGVVQDVPRHVLRMSLKQS